jgi:p-aminobenzoyl-glutamate transporter AbgT
MAVGLTDLLESAGMNGVPAFVGLALLSAFLCMFIASGSAIWSILAPIFVPMFMLLGFHPAFAQILFRIADSSVRRWRRYRRLCRYFSASYSATGPTLSLEPTTRWSCLIH